MGWSEREFLECSPVRMPLQTAQCLVQIAIGRPTEDAAVVVQAAHIPVVVIERLYKAQAVESKYDLRVQHLVVGFGAGYPTHRPVWIQGDSFLVPGYVTDLLKGPTRG